VPGVHWSWVFYFDIRGLQEEGVGENFPPNYLFMSYGC
jgi:hypothetical protein